MLNELDATKAELSSQIKEKANISTTNNIQQQLNNLVLGAVGDGNNAEVVQARDNEQTLNERLSKIENGKRITNINFNNFKKTNVDIIDYTQILYDKYIVGYNTSTNEPVYGDLINNVVVKINTQPYCGTIKVPKNNVSGQFILLSSNNKVFKNFTYDAFINLKNNWLKIYNDYFEINCANLCADFYTTYAKETTELFISMNANNCFAYRDNGIRIDDNNSLIKSYANNTYPFCFNSSLIKDNRNFKSLAIALKDVVIYTNNINDKFYVSYIKKDDNYFHIQISNSTGTVLSAENIEVKDEIQKIYLHKQNNSRENGFIIINTSEIDEEIKCWGWYSLSYDVAGLSQAVIHESPKLIIPPKIYGVANTEIAFYIKNITKSNLNDYIIKKARGTGDFVTRNRIIYKDSAWENTTLFDIYNKKGEKITNYSIPFKIASRESNKGITKKCMFIGDSFIASHKITNELGDNLFKNDPMKIKLLGTQGWTWKHEGRAGWSTYDYVATESFNGSTNAFLNNGIFDFSYYISQNSMETPDWVFIQLGINDTWRPMNNTTTVQNLQTMINSIKQFDSNIKVGIALICPPYMGEFYLDNDIYSQNIRLDINENIINNFKNKESENIYIVPINTNLDCFYNFPMSTEAVNSRNSNTINKCTDTTHPDVSGYNQIADSYYCFLKCN